MRESGHLVAKVLQHLVKLIEPGISLLDLDAEAERVTLRFGAVPAFKGYLGFQHTLCTSVNDRVVHGVPSKQTLKEGDIIGLDFGLKYKGYFGDSAVTVPVGKVSESTRLLLDRTRAALYAGIKASIAGNTVKDISRAVEASVAPYRYGIVREFVGHGIGLKLHEEPQVPNYEAGASTLRLKPGMTIAIEPMINEGSADVRVLEDKWTAVTVDKSLSAHFEHTIAISDSEPEILTDWEGGQFGIFSAHS